VGARLTAGRARDRAITISFALLSLAVAFWQKPGWAYTDTKIDLHVDPSRFLSFVASVWTSTTDLGEVHSAQYSGYLWPMGPFYAALHALGIGPWVVQRLWLAMILALAAWGLLRLLDVLIGRPRGAVHIVAAAFYVLNPYTVVFVARTTINLLGYAALPWLLLVTYYGVRSSAGWWRGWRGWWWAGAFALILTSTGGGVNAAVVGWMLVGPLLLALYEPVIGNVAWRGAFGFLGRVGVLGLLASAWWIIPVLVHVRYGIDFLQFTEQPSSIWATNSTTESLRLMGFWTSYIGVGYGTTRPIFTDVSTMLFNPLVVGASLLVPAFALAGFVRARRMLYAPLFLLLVVAGALIMVAGFPDGTPLRTGMTWVYHHVFVLRFMRTTYKAGPLVALGLASLLGLAAAQVLTKLKTLRRPRARTVAPLVAGGALTALIALAAWPLIQGKAIDNQSAWKRIPEAWTNAGRGLDKTLQPNTRALVLPGQIFAYYNWGGTVDAILPRLTDRPVAVRYQTPYSDLHAVDMLMTVDDLVQQRRLVPGELPALLRLMGVGAVVSGTDDDVSRSGALDPAEAAGVLSEQLGARPSNSYGPTRTLSAIGGDISTPLALPEVRRYDVTGARGIVHVDPTGPATVLDGGAQGAADLAAFGGLPSQAPLLYAGDLSTAALRRQAASGANIVISDSNRRREFLPESAQQDRGATLAAGQTLPTNGAMINPFPAPGANAQTVSMLRGARYVTAPAVAGQLQFPETGPLGAFDGDLSTAWVADRFGQTYDRWIEVGFTAPRDVPYVDVFPLSDAHARVTDIDVNGIHRHVGPGWTRIPVNLHHVSRLRVSIDRVVQPHTGNDGAGGFREIRIPGFHVSQLLRTPVVASGALAGTDLSRDSLSYVFERTTGDDPFRRNPYGVETVLDSALDRGDAEGAIDRIVVSPATRRYTADAWVYPTVATPDSTLDRLAGLRGSDSFDSSNRFQDQPAFRASSAFSGAGGPGWVGLWLPSKAPAPWISWRSARPLEFSRLRLAPSTLPVRRPTLVRLSWSGGTTAPLKVSADGSVALPAAVSGRAFRLAVLDAQLPAGIPVRADLAPAVGIGSIDVPGLKPVAIPRAGALPTRCGVASVRAGGAIVPLQVSGTTAELDAGLPLRAHSCGAPFTLGAGVQEIRALPGPFSVDLLRLSSPSPLPAAPPSGSGRVTNPGTIGQSSVTGARVDISGLRAWVVLGESFDRGWQASCDGRSLGTPQPIDGYANGWLAPASCHRLTFTFGPQSGAQTSYLVSALTCLALLVFLLVGALRGRVRPAIRAAIAQLPEAPARGLPLPQAAGVALLLSIAVGAIFALRAGAAAFPLLTFVLWRGFGPGTLVRIAAILMAVAVPIAYAIGSPPNLGGYNFAYSTKLIGAHWIGVAVLVLLALATFKSLAAARPRRDRAEPPSAAWGLDEREQDAPARKEKEVIRG